MRSNEAELAKVRRGHLMEVASFLTYFQSQFLPESVRREQSPSTTSAQCVDAALPTSQKAPGILSPSDIENALEYRALLERLQDLEQEQFVTELYGQENELFGTIHQRRIEQIKDEIDRVQSQIDQRPEREKLVHRLYTRFEVWSTKAIAQSLFMKPSSDECATDVSAGTTTHPCCFAPLLNLPGSKHFQKILPEIEGGDPPVVEGIASAFHQHKPSCCCLPLPPNIHTWNEFARITKMTALLDAEGLELASQPPCRRHGFRGGQLRNPSFAQKFEFNQPDLVALWVRAQRNTQALRHLWSLFEIKKEESTEQCWAVVGKGHMGAGKRLVIDGTQNAETSKPSSFRAVFRGNNSQTRERIVEMSKLTDQLVEWAVVNQTIFTYRHIRTCIQSSAHLRRNKRRRTRALYHQSKRARLIEGNGEASVDETICRWACRAYFLRWFARRNRRVMMTLFASNLSLMYLDIGCTEGDIRQASKLKSVVKAIKKNLGKEFVSDVTAYSADRFLARIDRRLYSEGFEKRYDGNITLYSQVMALLEALSESASKEQIKPQLVEKAKSDFKMLYNHFFSTGKEIAETARDLIDRGCSEVTNVASILLSSPPPWILQCKICEKDNDKATLRYCANCEDVCHAECSSGSSDRSAVRLDDVIHGFSPLKELMRLKIPDTMPLPDFGGESDVTWTQKEITIDRSLGSNGKVPPLSLRVCQTELSQEQFNLFLSDDFLVTNLVEEVRNEKQTSKVKHPLLVEHHGCLVTLAQPGHPAALSGLMVGDVIVAAELGGFLDREPNCRLEESVSYSFWNLPASERLDILKKQVSKLKVTVMRPSQNIVESSTNWWASVKLLNTTLSSALDVMPRIDDETRLWFCAKCLKDRPIEPEESHGASIVQGARFCRAVIRRLGMESYALPFFDENPKDFISDTEDNDHSRFVSLRRLDSMLTWIMTKYKSDTLESPDAMALRKAFYCPPWAVSTHRPQRLDWASEEMEGKPLELLCRAVSLLTTSKSADAKRDAVSSRRSDFIRHFLSLFSAWCVGPQRRLEGLPVTGPSQLAVYTRVPWLRECCSTCLVRPCSDNDDGVCDNLKCSDAKSVWWLEEFEDIEVSYVTESIESYVTCASLVGTTFLVLPGDPLIEAVSRFVKINHNQRPVEFIVVSYIPPAVFETAPLSRRDEILDRFETGDGVFHLFPVVSLRQLSFLVQQCRTRSPPKKTSIDCVDHSWTMLDVLDFEGVPRFSQKELQKKLVEHRMFRSAIDDAVSNRGVKAASGEPNQEADQTGCRESGSEATGQGSFHFEFEDSTSFSSHAIDCLLYRTGLLSHELAAICPEHTSNLDEIADPPSVLEVEQIGPRKVGLPLIRPSALHSRYPVILPLPTAQERSCTIIYSDICCDIADEQRILEAALEREQLTEPMQACHRKDIENLKTKPSLACILMAAAEGQTEKLGKFDGVGWGFEVLEWQIEPGIYRIGRVVPKSTAHSSGLRTNDIILSIGGHGTNSFRYRLDLVCALLGVSCSRIRIAQTGVDAISRVLCTVKHAGLTLGPVFLTVHRPRQVEPTQQPETKEITRAEKSNFPTQGDAGAAVARVTTQPARDRRCEENRNPVVRVRAGTHSQAHRNHINTTETIRDLHRGGGNVLPPEWNGLYAVIDSTLHSRRSVSTRDLYCPGPRGTFLTLIEVAVFCGCLRHQQPMLGIRLLCPRYDLDHILSQTTILKAHPELVQNVPIIPDDMHRFLIWLDFKRSTSTEKPELGGPVFFEGIHQYRKPIACLPIDRLVEKWLHQRGEQPLHTHRRSHGAGENDTIPNGVSINGPSMLGPPATQYAGAGDSRDQVRGGRQEHGRFPAEHNGFSRVSPWPVRNETPTHPNESNQRVPFGGGYAHATNTQVQPWYQPPYQSDTVPDLAYGAGHSNSWDMPERIRGGGGTSVSESDSPRALCLADVPVDKWKDQPVFCTVKQKSEGGDEREAILVGFAKLPKGSESVSEAAEIDGYYLSSLGYFDKPRPFTLASDKLYIVDSESNSVEAKVIRKLYSKIAGPGRCVTGKGPVETQRAREPTEFEKRLVQLASESMVRCGQMRILGELPDGREVIWMQSDPRALYLRLHADSNSDPHVVQRAAAFQRQYLRCIKEQAPTKAGAPPSLRPCDSSRHCCLWGCSVPLVHGAASESVHEVLGFSSRAELEDHYSNCHAFAFALETVICDTERLVRIQEGEPICELNTALSSSICALRLELCKEASRRSSLPKTTASGFQFFCAPVAGSLALHPTPTLLVALEDLVRGDTHPPLRRLVLLWKGIARLFAVEDGGLFRLSQHAIHRTFLQRNSLLAESVPGNSSDTGAYCCLKNGESSAVRENSSCFLCSLPSEKVIGWRKAESESASPGQIYRGIGCALFGDMSDSDKSGVVTLRGRLGQAKSLLLRVSANIPDPLHFLEGTPTDFESDPLAGKRIWDEDHFSVWRSFVGEAMDVRMLVQAFVAMLASIRKSRLPEWWCGEGSGWSSSSLALLAQPTLPSFLLHLYVFDAAVAEFKSTAHLEKKSGRRVIAGTLAERMDKFLRLSEKHGFERYDGIHDSACIFCDGEGGGSLLPCELCKNVQHHMCCDPPVETPEELKGWICDVCINDINISMKAG